MSKLTEGEVDQISLILMDGHPRLPYYPRQWEKKKSIRHWGQRKLLLSEILFLTKWGDLASTVIYAGAAPGKHIEYLSKLFPKHNFILVDPNPFGITACDKIQIYNQYFTDQLAEELTKDRTHPILFISDIRTADFRQMTPLENENLIIKDNESQIQWVKIMKPIMSMLKFRCTYPDIIHDPCRMFKGTLFFQVWPPPSSTETRLIVDLNDNLEMMTYDCLAYEESLFYHNTVTRFKIYDHNVKAPGLDHRYDSMGEITILSEYLQKFHDFKDESLNLNIALMSQEISKQITTTGRTLLTPNSNPTRRRNFPSVNHSVFYDKSEQLTNLNNKPTQSQISHSNPYFYLANLDDTNSDFSSSPLSDSKTSVTDIEINL
jgi:cap2 methyltransferase